MNSRLYAVLITFTSLPVFVIVSFSLVCCSCGWYFFSYRPLQAKIQSFHEQNIRVRKRTALLKKRLGKSDQIRTVFTQLQQKTMRRVNELPDSLYRATDILLAHIQSEGLQLLAWKPGKRESSEYVAWQVFEGQVEGAFDQVLRFIEQKDYLQDYVLTGSSHTVILRGTFSVVSRL